MFYIIGLLNKKEYSLMYQKGKLSGDTEAIQKAQEETQKDHGLLGLMPDAVSSNYLANDLAAYDLIKNFVFDKVTRTNKSWKSDSKVIY